MRPNHKLQNEAEGAGAPPAAGELRIREDHRRRSRDDDLYDLM